MKITLDSSHNSVNRTVMQAECTSRAAALKVAFDPGLMEGVRYMVYIRLFSFC